MNSKTMAARENYELAQELAALLAVIDRLAPMDGGALDDARAMATELCNDLGLVVEDDDQDDSPDPGFAGLSDYDKARNAWIAVGSIFDSRPEDDPDREALGYAAELLAEVVVKRTSENVEGGR
jgi:hypothetical protein